MRMGAAIASSAPFDEPIVRPAGPLDREAIEIFVAALSPASRYLRFLHALRRLPEALMERLLRFDPPVGATLLAYPVHAPHELIAVAQYEAGPRPGECEVAVVVADAWQRQGVASLVLRQLAYVAWLGGLRTAFAEILSDNHGAIELARRLRCSVSLLAGTPQMTRVCASLERVLGPAVTEAQLGRAYLAPFTMR